MLTERTPLSLAGQTQRWRFTTGPTANQVYEHTFNEDGTVVWRAMTQQPAASSARKSGTAKEEPTRYASFEVDPGLHLVSYRSNSGYTLTMLVNPKNHELVGFASNEREWYPVQGVLEA